jgi:TetR/AcrR family transcriptional regulator, transcriptional repressor for nem operon
MTANSTREHLIDVGQKLMRQHGYNATGLSDILKAADVPKGSFYHHFDSKEDFAKAALERYGAHLGERTADALNDAKVSPLKRLKRLFTELIKTSGQAGAIPGCMMGRFSLEIATENAQLRKQVSTGLANWQDAIAAILEQAVAQKELPAHTDAQLLAGFVVNSWEGALLRSQADKSDAALETFMSYVFDGLLKQNGKR